MNSQIIVDELADCVGEACWNFAQALVDGAGTSCGYQSFGTINHNQPLGAGNMFSQTSCSGQIVNPFMLLSTSTFNQYANFEMCCNVYTTIFNPLCVSLLYICVIYTWIRLAVTIFYGVFIFRKKITPALNELIENEKIDDNLKNEVKDFRHVLTASYIVDFLGAFFSWWFFKGVQYYASLHYPANSYNATTPADPQPWGPNIVINDTNNTQHLTENLCLYNTYHMPVMMYIAVLIWFSIEVFSLWIQIFAVSSLTHLESYRYQGSNFYKKHRNWSFTWALLFGLVGGALLILHFCSNETNQSFGDYKLYFKYYSESTLTFWLCFCLVFILVLTDRYLAYEGFKKREKEGPQRRNDQPNITSFLESYRTELNPDTIKEELNKKFPDQDAENEKLANEIVGIYKDKMEKHIDEIKRMIRGLNDQGNHQTSMKYIIYLLIFNVFNLIGYIFMLVAYKRYNDDTFSADLSGGLQFFLVGFFITSAATFTYEISHNYLFYTCFFGPVHEFWKKSSISWS